MASPSPEPCSEQSSQAVAAAVDAGDTMSADVLHEILLRVPARSLRRFRGVCRSWRALLSDARFLAAHAPRHPLLLVGDRDAGGDIGFADLSGDVVRRVAAGPESHGVVEARAVGDLVLVAGRESRAAVLDLATGATSVLPADDTRGRTSYMFGHVPSTGEYKVLRVRDGEACDLLTLGVGGRPAHGQTQWRAAQRPPVRVEPRPTDRTVVRSVAYFLPELSLCSSNLGNNNNNNGVKPDSIAAFDLDTEEWRPSPLRGPVTAILGNSGDPALSRLAQRIRLSLAELGGCLVTAHLNHHDPSSMDLWFLTDSEDGLWCKKYSILKPLGYSYMCLAQPLMALDEWRILLRLPNGVTGVHDTRDDTYTRLTSTKGSSAHGVYVGHLA